MNPPELIEKHISGDLTEAEAQALADWLHEDQAHVEEFVRVTHVHASLHEVMEEALDVEASSTMRALLPEARPERRLWRSKFIMPLVAASVLFTVFLGFYAMRPLVDPRIVARVLETSPDVVVQRGEQEIRLRTGTVLLRGDRIQTDVLQRVSFVCEREGARIDLNHETALEIWGGRDGGIVLKRGSIDVDVEKQPKDRPFVLGTPHAKVDVLGTTFQLSASTSATRLDMEEGIARLTHLANGSSQEVYEWGYGYVQSDLDLYVFPPKGKARWVKTVKKLNVNLPRARGPGIAFDGSALWLTVNDPPKLFQVNPENGEILKALDVGKEFKSIGNMTWNGEHLIVSGRLHSTYRDSEVCAVDPSTGKILKQFVRPGQLRYISAFKSVACHDGFVWAVLPQGGRVDKIDLETGKTKSSFHIHHPEILTCAYVQGTFWTTGDNCLYKMSASNMKAVDFFRNLDVNEIRDMVHDGQGRLWMAGVTDAIVLVDLNEVFSGPNATEKTQ